MHPGNEKITTRFRAGQSVRRSPQSAAELVRQSLTARAIYRGKKAVVYRGKPPPSAALASSVAD
jgi:hypothetical protein